MLAYRKNTESKNLGMAKASEGKLRLLLKCALCYLKKLRFIITQEASGLLSSLGLKTPLRKIPLLGDVLKSINTLIQDIK